MTDTAEIIADAEATRGRVAEARAEATDALNLAYELMELAAAHGWEGVAVSMRSAQEAVEAVVGQLDRADQEVEAALAGLREITATLSRQEVADRLTGVLDHIEEVRGGVDAATESALDARHAAGQAGEPRDFLEILQVVFDDLDTARQCAEHTRNLTETERAAAERWGD